MLIIDLRPQLIFNFIFPANYVILLGGAVFPKSQPNFTQVFLLKSIEKR